MFGAHVATDLDAGAVPEADVKHGDMWLGRGDQAHGAGGRAVFADDFEVGFGIDHVGDAAAHDLVVVKQEHADRIAHDSHSRCPLRCGLRALLPTGGFPQCRGMNPNPVLAPELIETNLAYVFLTADRAYKLLKPVQLPFLDLQDPEVRRAAVAREFALNSKFSPSVYLGVAALTDGSDAPETALVMRRLDADRELHRVVDSRPDVLRRVARRIATVHSDADSLHGDDAAPASPAALRRNWQDNLDVIRRHAGVVASTADIDVVAELAARFIDGREALFAERQAEGWVRDGHGDLRCEHVFVEDHDIELIDCLAFADEYRIADVLNDIAFLAMDLHRLCGADAAMVLMNDWLEFTNEHHPSSLAHFFVAYRAHVRTKVECLRHEAGVLGAAEAARRYHELALHHLGVAQPRMILVGGGPGSGKSTLSQGLARRLGAVWIRSDEVRKDIAGLGHDDHAFAEPGEGIYTPEMTAQLHEELRRQATLLLQRGESVVVDATWSSAETRAAMRSCADVAAAEVDELQCVLPAAVARERIARRSASIYNPSDATPELVDHMMARFDPWPEAREISTNQPVAKSLEDAADAVLGRPSNTSHHERRYFIDAPVTIHNDQLVMTHEGAAPIDPLLLDPEGIGVPGLDAASQAMGTFAPAGVGPADGE